MSYFDATGKRREKSTRTTDRRVAERIAADLESKVALRREGIVDARKDRYGVENRKPLVEHTSDYLAHCRHVGHSKKHIIEKVRHLDRVMNGTGATRLSDLTADTLENHLRNMSEAGLSARTVNFCRQVVVAFVEWCVRVRRVESNPLTVVPKLDERKDRRLIRRPLTEQELTALLLVAEPRGRKAWYLAAALAGLRKGDLLRLIWADIDFEEGTITIRNGKAKRTDIIPMHPQLAEELHKRRSEAMAMPTARVFPTEVTNLTRQKDFLRAGIAREEVVTDTEGNPVMVGKGKRRRPKTRIVTEDAEGRVIDLHAMRTTLGTNLARAGVAPQLAQRIMRHADYRTTQEHYTVLGLTDTAKAIESLPAIPTTTSTAAAATGTYDAGPSETRAKDLQQIHQQSVRNSQLLSARACDEDNPNQVNAGDDKCLSHAKIDSAVRAGTSRGKKAGERTRTVNIQLGRLMLYQLSYARVDVA